MKKEFILSLVTAASLLILHQGSFPESATAALAEAASGAGSIDFSSVDSSRGASAALLATSQPVSVALTYDEYMELGYSAANEGNYAEAARYFREALFLNPNDREATIAYWNSRDAIEQEPNEGTSTYDRNMEAGYDATEAGSYEAALQHFQTALQQRPGDHYATQAIRNVQTYLGREDLQPFVGESAYDRYMRLGYAAAQDGQHLQAMDYFRSALDANPGDRAANIAYWNSVNSLQGSSGTGGQDSSQLYDRHMRRGYDATQRDDYERALDHFQRALELRPDDIYARDAIDNVRSYME